MKKIPLFTAKEKFTLKSFDDDIHNTHFTYSEKNLYMNEYFKNTYGEDKENYVSTNNKIILLCNKNGKR